MKARLLVGIAFFVVSNPLLAQSGTQPPTFQNQSAPVEARVHDLLSRMTLEEKATLLSGAGWMDTAPIPRLGIPAIHMADGPMGIRNWVGSSAETNAPAAKRSFASTAFPAGIAVGATWDPELARAEGAVIGAEMSAIGRDMILGPTVNIQRAPLWGRNFEGYGEDPYLTGRMAVGYIEGVQSQGVIATVKHFVANNEEFERHRIDVAVDERALREIYTPAFEAAIHDGHVWSVMTAYNKVNGVYCAESPLIKGLLEKAWGFQGFVVSDWGSTYSTAPTVNAGMDIEMPGGDAMRRWIVAKGTIAAGNGGGFLVADKVVPLVRNGTIPMSNLDDNVSRILRVIIESGLYDHPREGGGAIDTPQQRAVARKAAEESITLLKNEHTLLPLSTEAVHSIAVIGPNAATARTGGGGSSLVYSRQVISPLEGIRARAGSIPVNYALGVPMAGQDPAADTQENRSKLLTEAVAAARASDVAVVFIGYSDKYERESADRTSMSLPAGQDELVEAIAAANPKTIVVFNSGDPVDLTRWIDRVPATLEAWYGGEEGGHAIASALFGDVNPSGKLPFTFIRKLADSPATANYPGVNLHVRYAEGIYVGYRYFDKHADVAPLFPFGFGLSYTTFAYSNLHLPARSSGSNDIDVQFDVKNTGTRAGAEVVQLYVSDPHASVDRPQKELKGFARIDLAPGASRTVHLTLDRRALSFYSVASQQWVAEPGRFDVLVGASSRDIRLKGSFDLTR